MCDPLFLLTASFFFVEGPWLPDLGFLGGYLVGDSCGVDGGSDGPGK